MPIKAIVVEDERLPRLALLQKLEDFRPMVEVVDSCDDFNKALSSILRHRPQLLFLDIQLQGQNALQLLDELQKSIPLPHIIFTTAYNDREYLMKAIKLQAVDYLLKPIDRNELAIAISKIVNLHQQETATPTSNADTERKLFKTANGHLFISPDDILYICADGNYAVVTTTTDEVMVTESLIVIESRLKSDVFIRADRKSIINKRHIYRINTKKNTCIFRSTDGTEKELSLSQRGIRLLLSEMT